MLPGYHLFFRYIAGKNTKTAPDQPKENLGIEEKGEEMGRLPLSYKFHSTGRVSSPVITPYSIDEVQTEKTSPVIRAEDFPREGYMGEGVYYG